MRRTAPSSPARRRAAGARTLVRETREGLRACIYYPDGMIRRLELFPPQRGLGDENVDAFADLVEELDHLLLLAERSAAAAAGHAVRAGAARQRQQAPGAVPLPRR